MANGESVVEDVLVKGRFDGSEIEEGIPKSVDKGIKKAGFSVAKFGEDTSLTTKQLVGFGKALKETGATMGDLITEFKAGGAGAKDMRAVLAELGYGVEEINQALPQTAKELKETGTGFQRVGDAVKYAVFRFFTALIIYQTLRKIIRAVSEAISESIRLWRELATAQRTLSANLMVNLELVGEGVGTLKEWNEWIIRTADNWNTTTKSVLDAANAALQANTTLKLSTKELQEIVELGRAVAIMWGLYADGQIDVAKGVDLVIGATRGEQAAMGKLGFTIEDVAASVDETVDGFKELPEAMQQSIIRAFIMAERFEEIGQAAEGAVEGVEAFATTLDAAIVEQKTRLGEFGALMANLPKFLELGFLGVIEVVQRFTSWLGRLRDASLEAKVALTFLLNAALGPMAPEVIIIGKALGGLSDWLRDLVKKAKEAIPGLSDLSDEVKKSGEEALEAAKKWISLLRVIRGVPSIISKAAAALRAAVEQVKEAAQPYIDLGRAIGEALIDNLRSAEDAARNFGRRMADLTSDLARNIARLGRRFEARAAELVLRAEERKEDIREDFRKREEQERDDLNLRLRHMEEDFLLDMKHLREQYEMDIEEAARARDWRAIRTLQRRYGLEKRQRGEDYQLQRKQFIESWEQRHKRRKKDLDEELKEVEDNLAKQLAALERERQRELEELKIRHRERQAELRQQYAQELGDLQRNLERRLADILTAAIQEGTIQIGEATKVTQALAGLYGINAQNLETMVRHDIEWLGAWAGAWATALQGISQGRSAMAGVTIGGQFYPYPTAPFSFAKGGMAIATKPTLVKVGEAGPELFTAIPLGKGGSVLGGMQNYMSGDFNLNISGDQIGQWSGDFERQVTDVVAGIFREAFEE